MAEALAPKAAARGTNDILLNNYFHDAIPKFRRENENSSVLVPILHGKCILAVHPNKDCATIFVGSQNFSKAAWGYGNQQPTNVEIGVVMCVKGIEEVKDLQALSLPGSVLEFFEGRLGIPQGGFPEPLRSQLLRGQEGIEGRPGAQMQPFDFKAYA